MVAFHRLYTEYKSYYRQYKTYSGGGKNNAEYSKHKACSGISLVRILRHRIRIAVISVLSVIGRDISVAVIRGNAAIILGSVAIERHIILLRISILRPVKRLIVYLPAAVRLAVHRLFVSRLPIVGLTANILSFKGMAAEILITECLLAIIPRIIRLPSGHRSVTGAIARLIIRPIIWPVKRLIVIGCTVPGVLRAIIVQNGRSDVISDSRRLRIALPHSKIVVGILHSRSVVCVSAYSLVFV